MEEGNPSRFGTSSGAGTSGAGPSFQGASSMSNDEVLARMMSRMDMFDTLLNGMESMIADKFQSIELARSNHALGHARATRTEKVASQVRATHALDVPSSTPVLVGDSYRIVGARDDSSNDEEAEDAGNANMEEGNPSRFGTSSGAGTSGAGPSFQGASSMSNDEVLARMMSRMDMFDTLLNGMESMIADKFQSIEVMHGSLDSRIDTLQGQLHTVI
ncbi:hypothetical protein JCGZ_19681 [Jatropha curcas]|uniref:Uncharacterized protein n=1 Tax=Jatropha curcas TaxID=180498 RepID=A0A067LJ23_JATCU|nr:hypothetical protein JCGZ_19681 [Jatropha curcas]